MIIAVAKCPYCGEMINIDNEDANPFEGNDELYIESCPECGKFFTYTTKISVNVETYKCDCQLENHKWELSTTYPMCASTMYCPECGERRPLTEEERKLYNIETKEDYFKRINQKG